jgi:hypothetical protein
MRSGVPALLCVFVATCGDAANKRPQAQGPSPDDTTTVDLHHCTISLARKAVDTFAGNGRDADPVKAKEMAWTDACARLPEATRAHCRDARWFTPAETSSAADGAHAVIVTLTPVQAKITGKAELEPSKDAACTAALLKACAAAGVPEDCVASGAYVKAGEVAGRTATVLSPPQ